MQKVIRLDFSVKMSFCGHESSTRTGNTKLFVQSMQILYSILEKKWEKSRK